PRRRCAGGASDESRDAVEEHEPDHVLCAAACGSRTGFARNRRDLCDSGRPWTDDVWQLPARSEEGGFCVPASVVRTWHRKYRYRDAGGADRHLAPQSLTRQVCGFSRTAGEPDRPCATLAPPRAARATLAVSKRL